MPRPDASERLAATKPKDGPPKALIAAVIVAVLVIAGLGAFFVNQANKSTSADAIPKGGLANGSGINPYPDVAKAGAPTVDIYEDFQCPICGDLEKSNGAQIAADAKSGKIKLVYHMMTFLDDREGNKASALAANASYCAADAGKFEEYHSANYAGQPAREGDGYTVAQIKQFGVTAGISGSALATFNKCVDDNKYSQYVSATEAKSGKDGVTATPTIKINGKALSNQDAGAVISQPNTWEQVLASNSK